MSDETEICCLNISAVREEFLQVHCHLLETELAELVGSTAGKPYENLDTGDCVVRSHGKTMSRRDRVVLSKKSEPQIYGSRPINGPPAVFAARLPKELVASTYLNADFMSFHPT
jgi:hypothetical protein